MTKIIFYKITLYIHNIFINLRLVKKTKVSNLILLE